LDANGIHSLEGANSTRKKIGGRRGGFVKDVGLLHFSPLSTWVHIMLRTLAHVEEVNLGL
jgi:hypothetical protein